MDECDKKFLLLISTKQIALKCRFFEGESSKTVLKKCFN